MFKKLLLFLSLAVICFMQILACEADVTTKQIVKLDNLSINRMGDLIYKKIYHQVVNHIAKNKLYDEEDYLRFAKDIISIQDIKYLESIDFFEYLEEMQQIARILNKVKKLSHEALGNFFDKRNLRHDSKLIMHLVYCFEEQRDIENIEKLIPYLDNGESDYGIDSNYLVKYRKECPHNAKDQALISLIKLYAEKNDWGQVKVLLGNIWTFRNRIIGFREFVKAYSFEKEGEMGLLDFFAEVFYLKEIEDNAINVIFWLGDEEPEILYRFLELHVKNNDSDLISEKDSVLNQIKMREARYVDLGLFLPYQQAIRHILNKEYFEASNIYLYSSGFGTSSWACIIKERLEEEYLNAIAFDKDFKKASFPSSKIYRETYGIQCYFDKRLLLMRSYYSRGMLEPAWEILKDENYYPKSDPYHERSNPFVKWDMDINVLKYMVWCMDQPNGDED